MTTAMPVFYPSCMVNLTLRLDEALSAMKAPMPMDIIQFSKAFVSAVTGDNLSHIVGRIPKDGTFELTGYRQAWKFDLTIEYQDLPIDPRLFRAIGVEIYLDSVKPEDFGAGMVEKLPVTMPGQFKPTLPRRRSMLSPTEDNLVMVGIADEGEALHDKNNSIVTLHGRDLRGVLIDSPLQDPKFITSLDIKKQIHEVVADIINKHPLRSVFGPNFGVYALDEDWDGQEISSPFTVNGPRDGKGAKGTGAKSAPPGHDHNSFWDLITYYCYKCGAVPYFRGRRLCVRPARSLYENTKTQFSTAIQELVPAGLLKLFGVQTKDRWRKFVFGKDIKSYKFGRKYQGFKPKVIEVISIDTSSKKRGSQKQIKAQWPTMETLKKMAKASNTSIPPGGLAAMTDVLRIPVHGHGIIDQKRMQAIAYDVYEEVGRGEAGGAIETENLASFGGDNQSPDLLFLRPGDTIELLTDVRMLESRLPLVHEYVEQQRLDFEAAVARMTDRIGDARLARAVVATMRSWELQRFWRVSNVKLHWSSNGVGIAFDFQNYIEARSDAAPKSATPITKKPKKAKVNYP